MLGSASTAAISSWRIEQYRSLISLDTSSPSESAHALAYVTKIAPELPKDHLIVMNMCGRGDKDVFSVAEAIGVKL